MKNIICHLILLTYYRLKKIFIETGIAQGMIFRGNRKGKKHNFTIVVDPCCKSIEKFKGGIQWDMMESKNFNSNTTFRFKKRKWKHSDL